MFAKIPVHPVIEYFLPYKCTDIFINLWNKQS